MVRAVGYSQTPFHPRQPGRLCRGRERWIEPWELEEDDPLAQPLVRTVVSGAVFSDESASDAMRGVPHSGIELASMIAAFFPRKQMLAFMEDGHPADIPEAAENVELYEGYRAGGRETIGAVRWTLSLSKVAELRDLFGKKQDAEEKVRGILISPTEMVADDEEGNNPMLEQLYMLVGLGNLDSPPARYQPNALQAVLDYGQALILFHRDKHGPAMTIYSREELPLQSKLEGLAEKAGTLFVEFAIPPMLARWDRALSELRERWTAERDDDFPVPPAPEGQGWRPRARRTRGRKQAGEDATSEAPDNETPPAPTDDAAEGTATIDLDDLESMLSFASDLPPVKSKRAAQGEE